MGDWGNPGRAGVRSVIARSFLAWSENPVISSSCTPNAANPGRYRSRALYVLIRCAPGHAPHASPEPYSNSDIDKHDSPPTAFRRFARFLPLSWPGRAARKPRFVHTSRWNGDGGHSISRACTPPCREGYAGYQGRNACLDVCCHRRCHSMVPARYSRCSHSCQGLNFVARSEEHTSELQSRQYLVCRLLLEKKKEQTEMPALQTIQAAQIRSDEQRIVMQMH